MDLTDYVKRLQQRVLNSEIHRKALAKEAGVSVSWISKVANGKIKNPGVDSVDRVDKALTKLEHKTKP